MQDTIEGRVWCVGDELDTDQLIAGKYLTIIDPAELRKHVLENVDPTFSQQAKPGDILVAGENMGCGSSREHAPAALKAIPLGAVVANSFARIFFRNSINLGMPTIEAPGVREIFRPGDTCRILFKEGRVVNVTTGKEVRFPPLPAHLMDLLEQGGLVEKVRQELQRAEART
ncbi:MAG: 3-isopropylmalate dehydratase [Euryarchaeota archaeon]|nr:3-isopropylmalate dehydratase [Euryarchaeota archaeon]MDE1835693.1 3-isopropylmalate dehydratase [Euryarchaeota archaeon]MDE1880445.1 3-isopropylmalate dehydratase [Euryarchaeota archaeon]MDE2043883.1 3-isopropylmalate dehydratase [Thermoplasmata archaeon]